MSSEKVAEATIRSEILASWPAGENAETSQIQGGKALFDRTIESMRKASKPIADYLDSCDKLAWQELPFGESVVLPKIPLHAYLDEGGTSKYLSASLRYYLALRLVQARFYDEAAPILDELKPENSVDPTGVLLHRAVVANHLAEIDKGLEAISAFRQSEEKDSAIPRRYTELAKLLEFDLNRSKEHEQENPEKISRKMDDVRRRLGKGKTDKDTQQAEKDVMKSLDKLIEKIEQQAQQQAQNASDQGQQAQNPADDSRLLQQKGPGNVDRREFDPAGDWGDLPPKEREEALLKIEKEFPAHYRDIIEQYFREMASVPENH